MKGIKLKFWGVRGSRPVPGKDTLIYGGNTSCIELRFGKKLVILDAGTGICGLSQYLMSECTKESDCYNLDADILVTHTHWDHIMGIPFFMPMYKKRNKFRIYGCKSGDVPFIKQIKAIMVDPHFPVKFDQLQSDYTIKEVVPGDVIELADEEGEKIVVKTVPNIHPNGGMSYRMEYKGVSICYVTDFEYMSKDDPDSNRLIEFVRGSDLFIFDTNYTEKEYSGEADGTVKVGWGHSTWNRGIEIAKLGDVKRLCLFHHNAERTDDEMTNIEFEAQTQLHGTFAAKEGMVIEF